MTESEFIDSISGYDVLYDDEWDTIVVKKGDFVTTFESEKEPEVQQKSQTIRNIQVSEVDEIYATWEDIDLGGVKSLILGHIEAKSSQLRDVPIHRYSFHLPHEGRPEVIGLMRFETFALGSRFGFEMALRDIIETEISIVGDQFMRMYRMLQEEVIEEAIDREP